MKKLRKKLKSRSGETLAETLVALLIAAVALVMLAGAIAASVNVIQRGRDKLGEYYSANEASNGVVKMDGTGTAGTVKINGPADAFSEQSFNVSYYKNDKFSKTPVVAYEPTTSSSTTPAGG